MKKKKDKQKEEANPFHKDYGILSNSLYILRCIKKYKKSVLFLMILGAFTNSLMQYLWGFIGKFVIDIVQQQAQSPDKSLKPLVIVLCIVIAIELVSMLLNTFTDNKRWYNFIYIRMKLISERISKTLTLNYQALENPKMLDCMQKANQATGGDYNGVEGMMHSVYFLMVQTILILATLTLIATLNFWLVLIIAVLSIIQFIFFSYTVKKDRREIWDKIAPISRKNYYMERTTLDFSYAKDIRLYGMKNWLSKKQHTFLKEKHKKISKSRDFWTYNTIFSNGISLIRNITIYGYLIYSVIYNSLTIGNFTLYLSVSMTFSSSLTNLLTSLGEYKDRSMQVDDFRSFLDIKNPDDSTKTVPLPNNNNWTFEFKNVSFKYPNQDTYAVKNLNLTLEYGKRLAVVGLNGAGKTTFIKLLLRLYDVDEGEILLNGINVCCYDRIEYYKLFSPVFQNVEIFAFPMSENVSMKSPCDTDINKAEENLIQAGLGDKIKYLSNGVQTELLKILHDDGIDLSGGEKQKLALARALYKDAPIVVLDEPTAALDALAESKLYNDFDKIIGHKSAVYISHRLSSTRFCDSIAMFNNGEMIEYGTHDELLTQNGEYAKMFEVQSQYYKEQAVNLNG